MGQVYRAFDPRLHREVAIKICAARFSERFAREVQAISRLKLLYVYMSRWHGSLRAVSLAGGAPRQIVACVDGTSVAVGPESLYYVACGSGDAAVHVMNWATRDDRLLGTLEEAQRGWVPSSFSVSPDGSTVLYQRTISGDRQLMLIENFR